MRTIFGCIKSSETGRTVSVNSSFVTHLQDTIAGISKLSKKQNQRERLTAPVFGEERFHVSHRY